MKEVPSCLFILLSPVSSSLHVHCVMLCYLYHRHNGPLMEKDSLQKCVQNENVTSEFMEICKWLTDEIQVFSGAIEKITGIQKKC